ncbi:MAG: DNA repair protein RecO [Acidaminococcaceae bacterium]|nr:DNA repair protein RecO [Acidaminococcaceae bacterium]
MDSYKDEVIVLQVNNWQTADKKAVCFSRFHGKIVFLAYGARYPKSVSGRLIQPFACLEAEFYPGSRVDKLKSCQLATPMFQMELEQMAYGFLMAEMTERLTEQGEPSEDIYMLLQKALQLLVNRNPRLATLAYLIQLLDHCGIGPVYEVCVNCSRPAEGDGWFSEMQGGFLCAECHSVRGKAESLQPFHEGTRRLWQQLRMLDLAGPGNFSVKGAALMGLEQILHRYLVYQTEQPIKSLDFIRQLATE